MTDKINEFQKITIPVLKENGIVKASNFGSFARGEDTEDSDVDMLVELDKPMGLFFLAALKDKLEKASGKKIDLLTYRAINPLLKNHIYKDEIKIYG